MKIILIGAAGMLGTDLKQKLIDSGIETICYSLIEELDITDKIAIFQKLTQHTNIDYIINCAAYTLVDKAESEKDLSYKVNTIGVENLVEYCKENNIPIVHFSTDYIFDGTKDSPYLEEDVASPINFYGETKHQAEQIIIKNLQKYYIFRIQWVYGRNGKNFVDTILNLAAQKTEIKIVSDQFGSPTWTKDIANWVVTIIKKTIPFGIYNLTSDGYTNWYDFAKYFLKIKNISINLIPIKAIEYPTPAKRPKNSRLNLNKIIKTNVLQLRNWKEAISEYLNE